ncbi:class II aldolase/adducin family protein [Roseibium sp.]|uniref:class II aldolase/adducin family protein n=1 Tax=Roseibium sp. TaxID=1936156 RepID=UPI003A986590
MSANLPDTPELRRAVIETARALVDKRLTRGTSGNVSARVENGFLITPSGIAYEALSEDLIVFMDLEGGYFGETLPSSEWRMHMDIYRGHPNAGAVVHCHSPRATALSCLRRGIPAFHYMVAVAGGDRIDCAPYATFGTRALSEAMLQALGTRQACLLANHGQIAFGTSLAKALSVSEAIEELADQYLSALSCGEPVVLSEDEMSEILRKFQNYGKQANQQDPEAGDAFELPTRRG